MEQESSRGRAEAAAAADGISSLPLSTLFWESLESSSTEIPGDRTAHGSNLAVVNGSPEMPLREGFVSLCRCFPAVLRTSRAGKPLDAGAETPEELWKTLPGRTAQAAELHTDVERDERAKMCRWKRRRRQERKYR